MINMKVLGSQNDRVQSYILQLPVILQPSTRDSTKGQSRRRRRRGDPGVGGFHGIPQPVHC